MNIKLMERVWIIIVLEEDIVMDMVIVLQKELLLSLKKGTKKENV